MYSGLGISAKLSETRLKKGNMDRCMRGRQRRRETPISMPRSVHGRTAAALSEGELSMTVGGANRWKG